MRYTVLSPGFVIFTGFSESFILGSIVPPLSTAASLYTPPKAGVFLEVMRFVPTPQESIHAPWDKRESIKYSSKSLEAQIEASVKPASSSIFLAFFER